MIAQYDADVKDTALRRSQEPDLHNALAEIALAEGHPLDAAAEFRKGDMLPDGPVNMCVQCLPAQLGRAYDRAEMADSVIAAYERYLAVGSVLNSLQLPDGPYLAGIHKRLGELYDAKGDREKALTHDLAFIALWKDADTELQPKLAEVKARVARLNDPARN
jgi:tetratricopeptide (TPR) repeat protein